MLRILLPILGLVVVAKGAHRRRVVRHLSGRTPDEARQIIIDKATGRVGRDRAEEIADRLVARLEGAGRLTTTA